jgi:hypothetical protein
MLDDNTLRRTRGAGREDGGGLLRNLRVAQQKITRRAANLPLGAW